MAYTGETPNISTTGTGDGFDLMGLSYVRISGITFTLNGNGSFRIQQGANHNEIDNCTFNSPNGWNLSFLINANATSSWATHNWIHDNTFTTSGSAHGNAGTGCTDGGGDTLDIGAPGGTWSQTTDLDNNNTIENNVFAHAPHANTDNYGEYTVFRNNVYHNEPWSSGCTNTSIWPPDFSQGTSAYSSSTAYALGNVVSSGANFYVSVQNSNTGNAVTNTSWWQSAGTCSACVPNYSSYEGLYAHRNAQISEDYQRTATYVLVEGNRYGYSGINDTNGVGDNFDLAAPQNIVRFNFLYASMDNNLVFKYGWGDAVGSGGNGGTYNRVYNNTMYMGGYGYPLGLTCTAVMLAAGNESCPQSDANTDTYAGSNSGIGNVFKNNLLYSGDGYSTWGSDFISGAIEGSSPPYGVGNGWLDLSIPASNNWCSGPQPSGTPAGACTASGNPNFNNPDLSNPASTTLPDLSLQSGSPAINGGTYLTTAINSGTSSTTLTVADALYFQDGTWGSDLSRPAAGLGGTMQADWIAIGTVTNVVQISSVTYGAYNAPAGTITLVSPMTWSNGAPIWLCKKSDGAVVLNGAAPNYGADPSTGTANPAPAATPTFSPVGGTYSSAQSVTISTTTSGATICYTTDGSTPTANGAGTCTHGLTYASAITVSSNETVEAIASESGYADSAVGSAAYTLTNNATFSPASLSFGNVVNGQSSSPLVTTLCNGAWSGSSCTPSGATLSGIVVSLGGTNGGQFSYVSNPATNCGGTLGAGATCAISVTFTPDAVAAFSASLNVADNASGSPQEVALSGNGVAAPTADFTISATPPSLTLSGGQSGTVTVTVTPENGFNQAVSFSCSAGAPVSCGGFSSSTVTPNGSVVSSTLTLTASASSSELGRFREGPLYGVMVAGFLGVMTVGIRRRGAQSGVRFLVLAIVVTLAGLWVGSCSSNSRPVTNTSTSMVTVTGTAGTLSHTVTVTVTVTH